jgi:hypothetical protein
MVKRTVTLVVCLLALSLAALAEGTALTRPDAHSAGNPAVFGGNSVIHADGEGSRAIDNIVFRRDLPATPAPEPSNLLMFGAATLLAYRMFRRKPRVC